MYLPSAPNDESMLQEGKGNVESHLAKTDERSDSTLQGQMALYPPMMNSATEPAIKLSI